MSKCVCEASAKAAILPSINSHPNNIEIYEAVNESVTFQSEGKQKIRIERL